MSTFNVGGDETKSAFCRLVRRYSRRFGKRLNELFDSEYDIRSFLKETYIDWMLKCPVREGLPIEARFPLEIAKDKTQLPRIKQGGDSEALEKLRLEMIRAVDDVVPLFGLDSENQRFAAMRLRPLKWGFEELVSQIVVSELLSDKTVGIVDATKWWPHWRGGML